MSHRTYAQLVEEIVRLHDAKGHDYDDGAGRDNLHAAAELGIDPFLGVLLRISDKWHRITAITRKKAYHVKDETVTDTLLDMANYALLAVEIYEEQQYGRTEKKRGEASTVDHPEETDVERLAAWGNTNPSGGSPATRTMRDMRSDAGGRLSDIRPERGSLSSRLREADSTASGESKDGG
jgi:hypothetical protein